MKRNILTYVAFASVLILSVACNRKVEYVYDTYVTMYNTSYTINENVGQLKVPVILRNASGSEVQVSVKLNEGKALEGVDYELIEPASGILTFSGETDSLAVVIGITEFKGEFTGSKNFTIDITSLSENIYMGSYSRADVNINDLDHPMAPVLGSWSGTTTEELYGSAINMIFEIASDPNKPEEFDKLLITTYDPFVLSGLKVNLEATATLNEDGTGEIVIPSDQPLGMDLNAGPGVYKGVDAAEYGSASYYSDIVMALNADGTLTAINGYGVFDNQYIYGFYMGGYTLTKN